MAESTQALMQRAIAAFSVGDLATAGQLSDRLLGMAPHDINVWLLRGRIAARTSRWSQAEEALNRAAQLAPKEGEVPFARAMMRMRQGRMAEAAELLAKAEQLRPNHPEARSARAECYRQMGQPKKALDILGRAPTTQSQAVTVSEAMIDLGDLESAEKVLRDAMAWEFRNTTSKQHMLRRLGELREQQGDYAGAFEHYRRSREGLRVNFLLEDAQRELGRVVKAFTPEAIASMAKSTNTSRRPIFIVGMPRSGTTLLEKMIASHPKAAGAGETNAFRAQLQPYATPPEEARRWPEVISVISTEELDGIANAYLSLTEQYVAPGVERVADKHLQNWMLAGIISACFPNATMVHIERDPFDTGISCFERLVPAAMPWCCRLDWVGQMLAVNDWLMNHWHTVMPGRMLRVRYEDLVREPAKHLKPILDAADLPWDDACLRHHERQHAGLREPPPTLSADQIRRPVYDTAIGRADRFGAVLDPMREAYRAARATLGLA